ncbi:hypothetical protein STEG23_019721, partial [Scotinomys teguina]
LSHPWDSTRTAALRTKSWMCWPSWFLDPEVGARPRLDCTSSSLKSVPCP